MRWRRLLSVLCWIKPALHVLSIPGYLDDGHSWISILQLLADKMSLLDWALTAVGLAGATWAFGPDIWARRPQQWPPDADRATEVVEDMDTLAHHLRIILPGMEKTSAEMRSGNYGANYVDQESLASFWVLMTKDEDYKKWIGQGPMDTAMMYRIRRCRDIFRTYGYKKGRKKVEE